MNVWLKHISGIFFFSARLSLAGVNISGDLKKPGYAIPFGTLTASLFTFVVYILLGKLFNVIT